MLHKKTFVLTVSFVTVIIRADAAGQWGYELPVSPSELTAVLTSGRSGPRPQDLPNVWVTWQDEALCVLRFMKHYEGQTC